MVPPENAIASSLSPSLDDETLLARLQAGGLVIVFRHGKTHRDQTDGVGAARLADSPPLERQTAFLDCSQQRVLTDEGRAELREVAAAIQGIGFVVSDVQASPMCRTRETAWLAFGRVTPNDVLVTPRALAERRELAGTIPAPGTNRVLVSHSQLVASIVWYPANPAMAGEIGLPEGYAFVIEPQGDSRYRFLARLGPEDWARLVQKAAAP